MAFASWLTLQDLLSPAALTIQVQALNPNDKGLLMWDIFFPRQDVPSVILNNLTTLDYRPSADRREWNTRGRRIPMQTPARRTLNIVPIESNDKIDEYQMQRIAESTGPNGDLVREQVGVNLSDRVDRLAMANYRRLEIDAMKAWSTGTIVQRDPENALITYTASFGFSSTRYTTEPTAWDNAGVNAYSLLQAWIAAAQDKVGPIEGIMCRQATFGAILADAPVLPGNVPMTRSMLGDRVSQDINAPFQFFINENSVDVFNDGGLAVTRTKLWPAQIIAAVPTGKKVGQTAFAPVNRAMEMVGSGGVYGGGVDVRGNTVYYGDSNGGRELDIECQLNALPVPNEAALYVSNVGV